MLGCCVVIVGMVGGGGEGAGEWESNWQKFWISKKICDNITGERLVPARYQFPPPPVQSGVSLVTQTDS
jgi:hypothetical protein